MYIFKTNIEIKTILHILFSKHYIKDKNGQLKA